MASEDVPGEVKAELARRLALYDPVALQWEVHYAVAALMRLNLAIDTRALLPFSFPTLANS